MVFIFIISAEQKINETTALCIERDTTGRNNPRNNKTTIIVFI